MSSYIGPKPSDQVVGSAGFSNINVGANVVLSTVGLTVGALGTVSVGNSSVNCVANSSGIFENGLGLTPYNMRNRIINGAMDVWQRGTSFSNMGANTTYTADRWSCYRGSYAANCSVTQVTGLSQNGNNRLALRMQRTSGDTNTSSLYLTQSLESINSRDLAGQQVTLSFWARAGSNFSGSSNYLTSIVVSGTGTDEFLRGAYTGYTTPINQNVTLTTSFQKFTFTGTLPSNCNEISVSLGYAPTGTAGANDWFDVMDVQLEQGSVATPFERRQYGTELDLCYRYCQAVKQGVGCWVNSTTCQINVPYIKPMRAAPTVSQTNTITVTDYTASDLTQSSSSISVLNGNDLYGTTVSMGNFSGATTGRIAGIRNYTGTGVIIFSAEL